MAAAQLSIPSLNRSVTLGTLYNSKNGELLYGLKLWSKEQIESMLHRQRNDSMECEFLKENSLSDKAKHLDVSGQLSLSLLSGAITVGGSGRYLTDSKQSSETESLTFRIQSKTEFEEIHLPPELKISDTDRFHGATHIVTAIQYGGTALFTFEMNKSDLKSEDNVSGGLQAEISKFAFLSTKGSVDLKLKTSEVATSQKIRVTYRGDFHLESPATTVSEALVGIQRVKGSQAKTPVQVTLTPLHWLTQEKVPANQELFSKDTIFNGLKIYESFNRAITATEQARDNLRSTFWTSLIRQLEIDLQQIKKEKRWLDETLSSHIRKISSEAASTEAEKEKLSMKLLPLENASQSHEQWSSKLLEEVKALVEISEELRRLKVMPVTSHSERTRFKLNAKNGDMLVRISLASAKFKLNSFKSAGSLNIFSTSQSEDGFYSGFYSLKKLIQANEASEPDDDSDTNAKESAEQAKKAVEQFEDLDSVDGISISLKVFTDGNWCDKPIPILASCHVACTMNASCKKQKTIKKARK